MYITDEELKKLIVQNGIATEKNVEELALYAKNAEMSLYDVVIEKNGIPEENLALLIATSLHVPFINLKNVAIPEDVYHIIPERIAKKYKVVAFEKSPEGVKIACTNPQDKELFELLAQKIGASLIPHLALERDIKNTLQLFRKDLQTLFDDLLHKRAPNDDINTAIDKAPIVKIVDTIIEYAYQSKTSDIHVEPQEKDSIVRFRIDGVLHDMLVIPKKMHERIITRFKVASRLRTDEHLTAQDGKMRIKLEEENLDIRVSILPIVDGEKVVLRLLSSRSRTFTLTDLGMSKKDLDIVSRAFHKSFGMILSTGPTGSGKSTSIYAILKILNVREKNITTIEDPVEYRIKGINQIQVNAKTNLTFAAGLRSILRQDPNVVFVGEIRDTETAGIAVNAALTGHLVLSTLHTNDAATALPRLTDMKIEPFLVASTVNVIIAQRLIRKICENCRVSFTMTEDDLGKNLPSEIIKKHYTPIGEKHEIRLYKGAGCKICHNTGYSGRVGLFEVLEVTQEIKKLIVQKVNSDIIAEQAQKESMTSMLDDGLDKVAKGITTIEEVLRVTKVQQ